LKIGEVKPEEGQREGEESNDPGHEKKKKGQMLLLAIPDN